MALKSRTIRLFFAALLVFSQHQAVQHLLGHDLSKLSQTDPTAPSELVCAKCLALAHLDHAVAGVVPVLAPAAAVHESIATVPAGHVDLAFFAGYRSRAPPAFS